MMNNLDYPFEIRPLTEDEGNGWLITFPDLPGCMSDGETPEEAIKNGEDAKQCWIQACTEAGRKIPQPGESNSSGKFITRVPKSLHAKLISRAKQEGVSMNALVASFIAECISQPSKGT